MIALALAAEAGSSGLGRRVPRSIVPALGWSLLGLGWLAFAALLLRAPLAYPHALRALITVLIGAGIVLRMLGWRAALDCAGAGALSVFCGGAAIGVTWLGGSPTLAANPLAALATGATFELLGTGSTWLGSAWLARSAKRSERTRRATGLAARTAARHNA